MSDKPATDADICTHIMQSGGATEMEAAMLARIDADKAALAAREALLAEAVPLVVREIKRLRDEGDWQRGNETGPTAALVTAYEAARIIRAKIEAAIGSTTEPAGDDDA